TLRHSGDATSDEQTSRPAPTPETDLRSSDLPEKIRRETEAVGHEREAYDRPGEAAEFYRLKRAPEGERDVPVERYLKAREQMRRMPRYSTAQHRLLPAESDSEAPAEETAPGAWTPLGPGNIGGRTRALLIAPANPNVMYAAGVTGGVWKTINSGASWTPLADLIANIAVSSMAMDPKNLNVIYAGTGEGVTGDFRGAGIFKTTDGGVTWAQLGGTGTSDFYFVNDIVVSPVNGQRIYVATGNGVWRSPNQPMLKMPEIMDANPVDAEAFGQMRADRLNQSAPASAGFDQLRRIECGFHPLLAGSHHPDALLPFQLLLEFKINEAFVGRDNAAKARSQHFQMIDVVWSGGKQQKMNDHPAARNPQAGLGAVIVQVFRVAVAVVSLPRKALVAWRARAGADRQRQRINRPDGVLCLTTQAGQTTL